MKSRVFITLLLILYLHTVPPSVVAATIRIMPLGDSITVGVDSGVVPDTNNFWVAYRLGL